MYKNATIFFMFIPKWKSLLLRKGVIFDIYYNIKVGWNYTSGWLILADVLLSTFNLLTPYSGKILPFEGQKIRNFEIKFVDSPSVNFLFVDPPE